MNTVDLAKELIGFETVSPVQDAEIFEFLKMYLEDHGIEAEIHDINGTKNLTAEIGDGDTHICLNGHVDVVDPGEGWTVTEPFNPREVDGKLYGRGSTDMKTAVAAQLKAFIDLNEEDDFDGKVTLMVIGDEEIGSKNGTEPLATAYADNGGIDYAVIGEPTDLDIQVGTRGVAWFNVYLKGEESHATRADGVDNVMESLPDVLDSLNGLEMSYSNDTVLPDPNAEVTTVETDDTYNSIPSVVRLGMDIRYLPEQSMEDIIQDIEAVLEQHDVEFEVELEMDHGGAYQLEDQRFRQIATEVLTDIRGEKPEGITEGGGSDGRFFAVHGTPFIELGTNQGQTHKVDEYCKIENIEKVREAYFRITKELAAEGKSGAKELEEKSELKA